MKAAPSPSLSQTYRHQWEELGRMDPLWAVLTERERKFGKWDLEEFFATGADEPAKVLDFAATLGHPTGRGRCLDFGCGVGRVTRHLANYFTECYGIDISESMVLSARRLNRDKRVCTFVVNSEPDLKIFPDSWFDFVYSNIVLQHLPRRSLIISYVAEFLRVVKPAGLVVFQLPSYIPIRNRIQPRRRAYALLRALGFNEHFLYYRLGLNPMHMNFVPEEQVCRSVTAFGGYVLAGQRDCHAGTSIQSRTYYVSKY